MKTSVVVVGAGPVGIRAVEEISAQQPGIAISLYGDEPCYPYNRILLSNYLSGQEDFNSIRNIPRIGRDTELKTFINCAIVNIDTANKRVYRGDGRTERYDKLVLATGSHAHVPQLDNIGLEGIFTLRNVADADVLKARDSQNIVILGGGLLGLETARALHCRGKAKVVVIDHSPTLMSRQLNKEAGNLLLEKVLRLGIEVSLASGVKTINGQGKVTSVTLRNGRDIKCDTLVLAIGIRPNVELAKQAGIATRHGIVVNERLQTSAPDVYAVGECAEFEHATYGIVAPGFEQARIMAANLSGRKQRYHGSLIATRLKVLDYPIFSMGLVGENEPALPHYRISFEEPMQYVYRYIIVHRWRLVGCIALGEWSELNRIRSAIESKKRLWPWELQRFQKTGLIWAEQTAESVMYWPDHEVVCNCSQVTRGQLGLAINSGCKTQTELVARTQAGTTCGSCVALLSELLGCRIEAVKGYESLTLFSFLALLLGMISCFFPALPYQQIATVEWFYDALWRDSFFKQVSGYSLLGCSLSLLTLSLRKRLERVTLGDFAWWRLLHVAAGFLTLLVLISHTGFRFGHHLNFYLMSCFSGLLLIGAVAGLVIAAEHKLNPGLARTLRSWLIWLHILLCWPFPALLGFHILQSYYF